MHKLQRTLPNDDRPFKGSSGHEMDINGCQDMAFVPHTSVTRPCHTSAA